METDSGIKNWFAGRSFFGFTFVPKAQYEDLIKSEGDSLLKRAAIGSENHKLRNQVQTLLLEKDELNKKVEEYRSSTRLGEFVNVFDGDPEPIDTERRKLYVAQVAGLHKDVLGPKLKNMLSKTFLLLEPSDNDRDFDQAVKGSIYFGRELLRWGERMVNEQMANQTQPEENKN